ncbi:UNVERIFIED_CONTAM: hypothetical protein FKN15_022193 [Acipenser sinensis]
MSLQLFITRRQQPLIPTPTTRRQQPLIPTPTTRRQQPLIPTPTTRRQQPLIPTPTTRRQQPLIPTPTTRRQQPLIPTPTTRRQQPLTPIPTIWKPSGQSGLQTCESRTGPTRLSSAIWWTFATTWKKERNYNTKPARKELGYNEPLLTFGWVLCRIPARQTFRAVRAANLRVKDGANPSLQRHLVDVRDNLEKGKKLQYQASTEGTETQRAITYL